MELEERRGRDKALREKVRQSNSRRYREVFLGYLTARESYQPAVPVLRAIAG
jgi:hypothetical protein